MVLEEIREGSSRGSVVSPLEYYKRAEYSHYYRFELYGIDNKQKRDVPWLTGLF